MPKVIVDLTARDNASRVFENMTSKIRDGVIQANLLGNAFNVAGNIASSTIGGITAKFSEAANLETGMISTTGTIMKMMGISYKEAGQYVENFQDKMSVVAAALPGATSDYTQLGTGIMDNLIPAFKGLDGVLDKESYTKTLEGITKNAGFLAITSGTDITNATNALSKLIGGASFDSLKNLKFFEANPAVLGFIEGEAKKLGKKFQDLGAKERAEVIDRALKIPDEVIFASTTSIQGLIASFQSSLFDPQTGVFGLFKDLEAREGKQTAFQSISQTFQIIFGTNGLLANVGNIFAQITGLNINSPMLMLRDGFDWLNYNLTYISNALYLISSKGKGLSLDFPKMIGGYMDEVLNLFNKLDPSKFGSMLAQGVNFLGSIAAVVAPKLINGVISGLNFVFAALPSFIQGINWGGLFQGIGVALGGIDWGSALQAGVKVLGVAIVAGLSAAAVGVFAASNFAAIIASGITVIGLVIGAPITLVVAAIAGIGFLLVTNFDFVKAQIGNLFNWIGGYIPSILTNLKDGFVSVFKILFAPQILLFEGVQKMVSGFRNFFGYIARLPAELMSLITTGKVSTPQPITSPIASVAGNAAEGFIPRDLYQAAARESQRMPGGASLVVANSTEAILNRSQQEAIGGRSSNTTLNFTGNIIVNGENSKEIAANVIREINEQWMRAKQNYVSPAYT